MNSAGRLSQLIKYLELNINQPLSNIFKQNYLIDINNTFEFLEFYIVIHTEITELENNLKKINKFDKYQNDVSKLNKIFAPNTKIIQINGLTNNNELKHLYTVLIGLEDLFESHGIKENIIDNNSFSEIEKIIDNLIEKLDNENYHSLITLLNEIKQALKYYKINGVLSIEDILEKIYCKGVRITLSEEQRKDFNSIAMSLYNIWKISKKYATKPIEYIKQKYDESEKDINDIESE
jgi:hypothetical protein